MRVYTCLSLENSEFESIPKVISGASVTESHTDHYKLLAVQVSHTIYINNEHPLLFLHLIFFFTFFFIMKEVKTEHILKEDRDTITSTTGEKGNFLQSVTARYTKIDPSSYLRQEGETSTNYWLRRLGHIKPVELLWSDSEHSELSRALTAFQLVFVGIGAIIGTGIFVLSGLAAAKNAGPAVTISFVIAAVAAGKVFY